MATKKSSQIENLDKITPKFSGFIPSSARPRKFNPIASCDCHREAVPRPAHRMGQLLALQQIDGVDSTLSSRLLSGQFDESHGIVDPLSDIHTDPLEFRDKLMQAGYSNVMPKKEATEN